ncbi:MAG TPA: hypothetical protein VH475_28555 [Tepidisphaeraceae bacterium]
MGAHYGSTHFPTTDRDAVRRAAETVAKARGIKCLLGPALNGWVGVYPEGHGQDESVGHDLAQHVPGLALHLLVHDDDIFAYWLWRDGQLIDSFHSRPGYFGEANRAAEQAMTGRPEAFEPLLGPRTQRLRPLLDRENHPTFASERLDQFAKLLRIPNALTAYEYLKDSETEGIKGWRQFEEIPAQQIAAEKSARQQARNRLTAEKKRLKSTGLLLAEESRKDAMARACPAADGFLVGWHGFPSARGKPDIAWHRPPWNKPEHPPISTTPQMNALAADPDARRIAVVLGNRVAVYDIDGWQVVREVPEKDWTFVAALSAEGNRLAHLNRGQIVVTDLKTGQRHATFPIRARSVALHPSGEWLVAAELGLQFFDLTSQASIQARNIRGRPTDDSEQNMEQHAAAPHSLDVNAFMARLREAAERGLLSLSEKEIAKARRRMEKVFKEAQQRLLERKARRAQEGDERPGLVYFSRDGQRLWCGTDRGLRGYEWPAVRDAAGDDMPEPRWRFDSRVPVDGGYIYHACEEPDGRAILFAGIDGNVRRLDLATSDVQEILTPPDGGGIIHLSLNADASALGLIINAGLDRARPGNRDNRCLWQIWNYRKLLDR